MKPLAYGLIDFLRHMDQAREECIAFVEAKRGFQSAREREAYSAGFKAGEQQARSMLKLHGDVSLRLTAQS